MMNQVWKEEYFIRALEETIEVESLLVEPQTHNASVDGVFFCPKENLECTEIVHLPCELGGQGANASGNRDDTSEPQVLNELPNEVGVENIQVSNGLSTSCEDYLLDTGFTESFAYFDYGFNDGLHLANSGLVSQNPGFTSSNNDTFGTCIAMTECRNNILDKTSLHCSFSCKNEPETLDEIKSLNCSTSCETPNVDKSTQSLRDLSSDKKEKNTFSVPDLTGEGMSCSSRSVENNETKPDCRSEEIESGHGWDGVTISSARESNIGTFIMQKRSRKPTQRYIDESSNHTLRRCRRRQEIPHSATKNKNLGVQCLKRRRSMGSKEKMLPVDDFFGEAIQVPFDSQAIQVPFNSQAPTHCPETQTAIQMGNSCEELSPAGSEDEPEARASSFGGSAQRKLHQVWTILEVRKLIDGVSSCGVGRWTEIKKLLFLSSDHRTPVDLKDKWRNLLKAARCPVKQNKREDDRKRNQPWRPLPKSVLCRVRELAMVHPYPREAKSKISKSKLSHVHHLSSPDLPARTKVFRFNELVVHEKNCT